MQNDTYYEKLFTRNQGYISDELQHKIRSTRLLIAGCGMGSTVAEASVRMGVETIILADMDTVSVHNLNRQLYTQEDTGKLKTEALEKRLKAINPELTVLRYDDGVSKDNVAEIISHSDFIFDTIDFLDTVSIATLHDEAHKQKKPLVSAVNAGFGAAAIYFPGDTPNDYSDFRKLFGLPLYGDLSSESYVTHYKGFIQKIHDELDPKVAEVMMKSLTVMEDGKPCPASQISAGSFAVASLAVTLLSRVLDGQSVTVSPRLLVVNMPTISMSEGINLES